MSASWAGLGSIVLALAESQNANSQDRNKPSVCVSALAPGIDGRVKRETGFLGLRGLGDFGRVTSSRLKIAELEELEAGGWRPHSSHSSSRLVWTELNVQCSQLTGLRLDKITSYNANTLGPFAFPRVKFGITVRGRSQIMAKVARHSAIKDGLL